MKLWDVKTSFLNVGVVKCRRFVRVQLKKFALFDINFGHFSKNMQHVNAWNRTKNEHFELKIGKTMNIETA